MVEALTPVIELSSNKLACAIGSAVKQIGNIHSSSTDKNRIEELIDKTQNGLFTFDTHEDNL